MKPLSAAMIAGLVFLLAACASISREECLQGNWHDIGMRDGQAGHVAQSRFARHVDSCARVDVAPDQTEWERGYRQGLQRYCTPQSGLREGRAGRAYRSVCPASAEPRFMQGHSLGMAEHRQSERIREVEREIRRIIEENRYLQARIGDGNGERELRRQLHANRAELSWLQMELHHARFALAAAERESRAFLAGL
ncbi:MAG: DUF2799 domain-containing protein [Pararhodobacter sp.]|nr:DUF2799 domain-containing protein [Pararhodobacter sp.]